jgi:hypothetical protein
MIEILLLLRPRTEVVATVLLKRVRLDRYADRHRQHQGSLGGDGADIRAISRLQNC